MSNTECQKSAHKPCEHGDRLPVEGMFRFSAIARKLPPVAAVVGRRRKSIKGGKRTMACEPRETTFVPRRFWESTRLHNQLNRGEANIKPGNSKDL